MRREILHVPGTRIGLSHGVRLLICTQVLDLDDSVLGFFHRWIEEFAKDCESVTVVCLFEGRYALPSNVHVYSLRKEKGAASRVVYAARLLKRIWQLRREYDSVFVHMNPEYAVLGGILWRLLGKRVGLWYVHKSVTLSLRIATVFVHRVFTASRESFRLATSKLIITGHGIDTDLFTPDSEVSRGNHLLSAGRLSKSKRHDHIIRAAALSGRELRIAGDGPERESLESLARSLGARVHFLGGLSRGRMRDEFRSAAYLVHTSETGSLDKVVLEALSTDTVVITTSDVFKDVPVHVVQATPEAIVEALSAPRENQDRVGSIRERHSLRRLVTTILSQYA